MSTAYLQRLFDRTAPGPSPQVTPAGASQSPIAEADQRFNNPALASLFSLRLAGAEVAGKGEGVVAPPGDIPSPIGKTVSEAAGAPFNAIGKVFPEDLAPPSNVQHSARAPLEEPAHAQPPSRAADAPPRADSVEPISRPSPASPEAIARAQPAPPPEPALQGHAVPPASAIDGRTRESVAAPRPPAAAVAAAMDDDAEPAAVMMLPPRTAPQPLAAPEPRAWPAKAVHPAPIREQPPVRVPAAETAPRKRPMTAAEASVIGPLVAEPRARTLFGLRRR
jgi:hypothetical protein